MKVSDSIYKIKSNFNFLSVRSCVSCTHRCRSRFSYSIRIRSLRLLFGSHRAICLSGLCSSSLLSSFTRSTNFIRCSRCCSISPLCSISLCLSIHPRVACCCSSSKGGRNLHCRHSWSRSHCPIGRSCHLKI